MTYSQQISLMLQIHKLDPFQTKPYVTLRFAGAVASGMNPFAEGR